MSRDYIPTPSPLPGKQYTPSNGSEGYGFIGGWCTKCARDRPSSEGVDFDDCTDDEVCQILAASFRGEAVEWRVLPGGKLTCIAFVAAGQRVPEPRCESTDDMFGDAPSQAEVE